MTRDLDLDMNVCIWRRLNARIYPKRIISTTKALGQETAESAGQMHGSYRRVRRIQLPCQSGPNSGMTRISRVVIRPDPTRPMSMEYPLTRPVICGKPLDPARLDPLSFSRPLDRTGGEGHDPPVKSFACFLFFFLMTALLDTKYSE